VKILHRLLGVITFKTPVYREIIEEANFWKETAVFMVVSALASSLSFTRLNGFTVQSVTRLIIPLINWVLFGYLCAFFMRIIYKASVSATGIMKIYSYAQIYGIFGLLLTMWAGKSPLGLLIGDAFLVLSLIAEFIGVREASQTSPGRTLVIFCLSFLVLIPFTLISTLIFA
jgi:hypothetical protein